MLRITCVTGKIEAKKEQFDDAKIDRAVFRLLCRVAIPILDPPDLKSKTAARAGTRHGSKDKKSAHSSYRNANRMARQSCGGGVA
uniref:hypothetical protein n=1 Tax=Brucella pseudintermedia TaxID=370111 RepID=UPI00158BC5E1|nr:hypothetical protein [Brucella pseudintermedia]